MDRTHFPTRGISFYTRHESSEKAWGSGTSFTRHYFDLKAYVPLHDRVSVLTHVVGGGVTGDDLPSHYQFILGGVDTPVELLERQRTMVTFLGLHNQELVGRQVQFAQLGLQVRTSRRTIILLRGNTGNVFDEWNSDLRNNRYEHGYGLTFGFLGPLGPVELTGSYGSAEEAMIHLNVGMKY